MKIAYVVGQFPVASKTFILNQIIGLIEQGHTVDIYAERPENESVIHQDFENYNLAARTTYPLQVPQNWFRRVFNGIGLAYANFHKNPKAILQSVNIFRYGRKAGSLRYLYEIIPFLDKVKYDIVHCHFGPNGNQTLPIRELGLLRGKLVITFHALGLTKYIQAMGTHIYDELFRQGSLFLPISHHWRNYLVKLGCEEYKLQVHRMGIDCSSFKVKPHSPQPTDFTRFISICRLVEKKGIEYSIRAIAEVAKKQVDLEYVIVGDGPLRGNLEELIHQLDAGHYIKILGWRNQQQVLNELEKVDVLLAPSVTARDGDQEGIPVAIMEAMAMGIPVVSTYHSGIPELIEDNVTGFLVAERSVDSLANRIEMLIHHPKKREIMGIKGRQRIQEEYDIKALNHKLINTFTGLISSE